MHLSKYPRVRFCHAPTPLEPLEKLTKVLGGPTIYIKRDDCTGLASGGNKTRKLEFLIGQALERRADTVITVGAVQSNHARQTAAAAARHGLECRILLERRVPQTNDRYEQTGNVFMNRLFGAQIEFHPDGGDMNQQGRDLAETLREEGREPYFIPGGGSNQIGALGYVNCAHELLQQANDQGLHIDYVVHATGSAGTQAGLVAAFEGGNTGVKVYGISVRLPREKQEELVYNLAAGTAADLGINPEIPRDSIVANSDYVGPGYGQPTPEMVEAVTLLAREEGILLDPVYSGKGMAGLIGEIRKGTFTKKDNIVFVHTGGSVSLFAYEELFAEAA